MTLADYLTIPRDDRNTLLLYAQVLTKPKFECDAAPQYRKIEQTIRVEINS
jgi:hypothetical protein